MRYHKIPDETVRRLPVYLRGLLFSSEKGRKNISSLDLAKLLAVNPWQIRKDFSYFGDFGTPGVGYDIQKLIKHINRILKLDGGHRAAMVGVGNLGAALLAYDGFGVFGFEIAAAFDIAPHKIGEKVHGVEIEDVEHITTLGERGIGLGIIAVPRAAAQRIAEELVSAGVTGILNFSPVHVDVPKKVKVISIDIAMDLARLPYYMPAG
jgi:redox-sensing transcriptional repressor